LQDFLPKKVGQFRLLPRNIKFWLQMEKNHNSDFSLWEPFTGYVYNDYDVRMRHISEVEGNWNRERKVA
jgi:hypothetical protein